MTITLENDMLKIPGVFKCNQGKSKIRRIYCMFSKVLKKFRFLLEILSTKSLKIIFTITNKTVYKIQNFINFINIA